MTAIIQIDFDAGLTGKRGRQSLTKLVRTAVNGYAVRKPNIPLVLTMPREDGGVTFYFGRKDKVKKADLETALGKALQGKFRSASVRTCKTPARLERFKNTKSTHMPSTLFTVSQPS